MVYRTAQSVLGSIATVKRSVHLPFVVVVVAAAVGEDDALKRNPFSWAAIVVQAGIFVVVGIGDVKAVEEETFGELGQWSGYSGYHRRVHSESL
jgi:hypothetical protein